MVYEGVRREKGEGGVRSQNEGGGGERGGRSFKESIDRSSLCV